MTNFKGGGIPIPDYDSDDINYISEKTEFTDDVFVYGKLYADLGGDVQTFSTAGVERIVIQKDGQVVFKNIGTSDEITTLTVGKQGNIKVERNHALSPKIQTLMESGIPEIRFENSDSLVQLKVASNDLEISGGQLRFPRLTESERDAITGTTGGVIYNTTNNKLQCWNGSSWNNLF